MIRVAIVGTGPSGLYALEELLRADNLDVEIDLFERLPTPYGLIRAGVAPDHNEKKMISDRLFNFAINDPRVRFFGNIEIGVDVTVEELKLAYEAVIFAVGARSHAELGIPGDALSGSWTAQQFVGFYNGHPDFARLPISLDTERVVIVGNGNVSLDMARFIATPLERMRKTDSSDAALAILEQSRVREIVILGRKGLEAAKFGNAELEEFRYIPGVAIKLQGESLARAAEAIAANGDWNARRRLDIFSDLQRQDPEAEKCRIVFRFFAEPEALYGGDQVRAVRIRNLTGHVGDPPIELETGLVLAAIGYRCAPLSGLPFDHQSGHFVNSDGRMSIPSAAAGVYVTGWAKRGCRGVIGTNRRCAIQSVSALLADHVAGLLPEAPKTREDLLDIIHSRAGRAITLSGWRAIDRLERGAGQKAGRPRVKFIDRAALLANCEEGVRS